VKISGQVDLLREGSFCISFARLERNMFYLCQKWNPRSPAVVYSGFYTDRAILANPTILIIIHRHGEGLHAEKMQFQT
jgi:hypothetical protein